MITGMLHDEVDRLFVGFLCCAFRRFFDALYYPEPRYLTESINTVQNMGFLADVYCIYFYRLLCEPLLRCSPVQLQRRFGIVPTGGLFVNSPAGAIPVPAG